MPNSKSAKYWYIFDLSADMFNLETIPNLYWNGNEKVINDARHTEESFIVKYMP